MIKPNGRTSSIGQLVVQSFGILGCSIFLFLDMFGHRDLLFSMGYSNPKLEQADPVYLAFVTLLGGCLAFGLRFKIDRVANAVLISVVNGMLAAIYFSNFSAPFSPAILIATFFSCALFSPWMKLDGNTQNLLNFFCQVALFFFALNSLLIGKNSPATVDLVFLNVNISISLLSYLICNRKETKLAQVLSYVLILAQVVSSFGFAWQIRVLVSISALVWLEWRTFVLAKRRF
jgi:hypothetical protein